MDIDFLQEPELEFGAGRHVDIRFGLMHYGPLDYANQLAPKQMKLGIAGTPQTIEGLQTWFEKTRHGIEAKPSKQPNLFPRFRVRSRGELSLLGVARFSASAADTANHHPAVREAC